MIATFSKTVSIALCISVVCFLAACGSKDQSLPKNTHPVELGIYETYSSTELRQSLQLACELQELSDTTAANGSVPLDEINKRKLSYLLKPMTYALSVVGLAQKNDREKVMKILGQPEIKKLFPADLRFVWSLNENRQEQMYELVALRIPSNGKAFITGKNIQDVVVTRNEQSGEIALELTMTNKGQQKWAIMTEKNIGKSLAIVCDDRVLSNPIVNEKITGGKTWISGDFSVNEAEKLAAGIKAGR